MNPSRIAQLLEPFLDNATAPPLAPAALNQISTYIDLLLRWNARVNLTAVRTTEQIVTRHFGESLFAARHLLPLPEPSPLSPSAPAPLTVDLGSGAGFPGLPMKMWSPQTKMTLIESNHKKATFLREAIRALTLTNIDVFPGRGEDFPPAFATLVTLRAVERFDQSLPIAAALLAPKGRLALLIGQSQVARANELLPALHWTKPLPIPLSESRVLLTSVPDQVG
jgi:16S rRNA (guanine527-N7)-methyltransferase